MGMALPQISVEIRWFFSGVSEIGVKNWFLSSPRFGEILTEQQGRIRSDLYLVAGGNPGIGPKLQEDRFEIKLVQQQEDISVSGGVVRGKGEIWHKWKWPYARAKKDKKIDEVVISSFVARTAEDQRVTWYEKVPLEGQAPLPHGQPGAAAPPEEKTLF
jgi:hypothetical protein